MEELPAAPGPRRRTWLLAILAVAIAMGAWWWLDRRAAGPAAPKAGPIAAGTDPALVASPTDEPPAVGVGIPTPGPIVALLRTEAPLRDLPELAVRMGRAVPPVSRVHEGEPPTYRTGDQERFWVHDIQNEQYFPITATLEVITPNAYFWVQNDQPFDRLALERGAKEFSATVMPDVRAVFGKEWSPGVDNDARVHLLHHENIPGVAGYFSSTDEFTAQVEPHSNEHEMFYVNLGVYTPGSFDYLALLAHEFQHMIHWNMDRDEPVWVNEGLSELSALIAGYQTQTGSLFLRSPDTPLMEWAPESAANGAHYAAAFLYFAYLKAQFGDEAIRAILAAPENGPAGIEAALRSIGAPRSFDETFLDWVAANRVDNAVIEGGRYSYRELPISPVDAPALPPDKVDDEVSPYGTDYYDLTGEVEGGALALDFEGDETIGLLDAEPSSTGRVWWSGRGDSGDSRLTRTFDLTGVDQANLDFRMWHDLETNWDYAYFLASRDNGATWTRLAPAGTTDADPNGNNFGHGLTGQSGTWTDESLDLTPFAGGPVTVRFEVVTDDAVSLSGLALDDLHLDAIGFRDDVEGDAGWQAEGWVPVDPRLAARWAPQLIVETDRSLAVERVPVSPDGKAHLALAGVPDDAKVTLAVSNLTPGTRHALGYSLRRPGD